MFKALLLAISFAASPTINLPTPTPSFQTSPKIIQQNPVDGSPDFNALKTLAAERAASASKNIGLQVTGIALFSKVTNGMMAEIVLSETVNAIHDTVALIFVWKDGRWQAADAFIPHEP